jgi:protein BCP1
VIQALAAYLAKHANGALAPLPSLFSPESSSQVGLILTDRLLNMPSEIVPPMYTMLLEEIQWALEEKEPYQFTHYLIWSKVYHEVASALDDESEERPKKKSKASKGAGGGELFYFHPEDEILQKYAIAHGTFDYDTKADEGASDSRRVFSEAGIKPSGHLILIEAAKFESAVKAIADYLKPPS